MNHPGEVTKKWRKQAKLSIPKLAKLSGIDKGTISRFERGGDFRRRIFEAVCKALGKMPSQAYAILGAEAPNDAPAELTEVSGGVSPEERRELCAKLEIALQKTKRSENVLRAAIDAAYKEIKERQP